MKKNGELLHIKQISAFDKLSDGRERALLREMVSDGTIEKVGMNKYTYYI